jgi:CrcB protein
MIWLAVAAGGALGSLARHGVNLAFAHLVAKPVPYATAAVNLFGSLVIGVLAGRIAAGRLIMGQPVRAFVFVGILGGFTTFSSFMLDTLTVAHGGDRALAMSNVIGQTGLGLMAVYIGYQMGALQ